MYQYFLNTIYLRFKNLLNRNRKNRLLLANNLLFYSCINEVVVNLHEHKFHEVLRPIKRI